MEHLFNSLLVNDESDVKKIVIVSLYGGSQKTVQEMTPDDFRSASVAVLTKVREQAFSRGLPIVYEVSGHTVREYPDGHLEPVY